MFEADEPVIDVGLIRLGRRGRRAQRRLQGAGGSRALPSRGHLLLGRLHPLLLPFLRPAWRWWWTMERGLGKLHHWNGWSCKETLLFSSLTPCSPLFELHLFLSHIQNVSPQNWASVPTTIFPLSSPPFKISVARISKQGKLRIVRSLPTHPDTKNPLHRQN